MIRIASPEPTSIFAFTGRALDEELGLQDNQHRHFDPTVGRWLSEEPIGCEAANADLYRYTDNRPQ